jgi:hypothetical protein
MRVLDCLPPKEQCRFERPGESHLESSGRTSKNVSRFVFSRKQRAVTPGGSPKPMPGAPLGNADGRGALTERGAVTKASQWLRQVDAVEDGRQPGAEISKPLPILLPHLKHRVPVCGRRLVV